MPVLEFCVTMVISRVSRGWDFPIAFVQHGSVNDLYAICGLDEKGIFSSITTDNEFMKIIIAGAGAVGTHLPNCCRAKAGYYPDGSE